MLFGHKEKKINHVKYLLLIIQVLKSRKSETNGTDYNMVYIGCS